jgi:hypothetical protein
MAKTRKTPKGAVTRASSKIARDLVGTVIRPSDEIVRDLIGESGAVYSVAFADVLQAVLVTPGLFCTKEAAEQKRLGFFQVMFTHLDPTFGLCIVLETAFRGGTRHLEDRVLCRAVRIEPPVDESNLPQWAR